jgi:hypothetical protein
MMGSDHEVLLTHLRQMDDESLQERWRRGHFASHALPAARDEFLRRGISLPVLEPSEALDLIPTVSHDLVIVARRLDPIEAQILRSALAAGGVPAIVDDANAANCFGHLGYVLDGVRVRVSDEHAARAREIIEDIAASRLMLEDEQHEAEATTPNVQEQRILSFTRDESLARRWSATAPRVPGFMWAALVFGPVWFFYRKLFRSGAVLFLIELAVMATLAASHTKPHVLFAVFLVLRAVTAAFAEVIYYLRTRHELARLSATPHDEAERQRLLRQRGGVSFPAALTAILAYRILTYPL